MLMKLVNHYKLVNIQYDPIEETWLIHDGTVLVTRLELNFAQRYGILNVTISEGIRDDHIKRPIWIGSGR
jgi:hypothetical protein